jgi:hypothetical protein
MTDEVRQKMGNRATVIFTNETETEIDRLRAQNAELRAQNAELVAALRDTIRECPFCGSPVELENWFIICTSLACSMRGIPLTP